MRLVAVTKLMSGTKDVLYTSFGVVLWGIAELTSGFLIIGILSAPKVAKSISDSNTVKYLTSLFLKRRDQDRLTSATSTPSHPSHGNNNSGFAGVLASWNRHRMEWAGRKRPDQWGDVSAISLEDSRSTKSLARGEVGDGL